MIWRRYEDMWTDDDWYRLTKWLDSRFGESLQQSYVVVKALHTEGDLNISAYMYARETNKPHKVKSRPEPNDRLQLLVRNAYHYSVRYSVQVQSEANVRRLADAGEDGTWRVSDKLAAIHMGAQGISAKVGRHQTVIQNGIDPVVGPPNGSVRGSDAVRAICSIGFAKKERRSNFTVRW